MKIKNAIFYFLLFAFTSGMAQSNPLYKKLDKANDLYNDNKLDDADKYLDNLLAKNPEFGDGWDLLVKVRYAEYQDSKKVKGVFHGNITVTTTDKDGKKVDAKDDTLANKLMEMLNSMDPSKQSYNKFIYTMRKATSISNDCYLSSIYLRMFCVDAPVDTNVKPKALKYFNDAESEFKDKNYEKAAKYYQEAIDEQPDFYKASLYLGDVYYSMKNYTEAIERFKAAIQRFPNQLEPRKYLMDAYAGDNQPSLALTEAIQALMVYPDLTIVAKMEKQAFELNKKVDIKWTPRPVLPNKMPQDTTKTDLNAYQEPDEKSPQKPWVYYVNALDKIKGSCNSKGLIIKPTSLTQQKYMEVYSWEEMLANSDDPQLAEAKQMQKAGYLDCYVLVTCFHQDFYAQYLDFVSKNKDRVTQYYNLYIH